MMSKKMIVGLAGLFVIQMFMPLVTTPAAALPAATRADEETTLYIAMQEDMPNFNYFDLSSNTVWKSYIIGWCFDSLSSLDPDGNIYPALAENWTFDKDNLTVTVNLRHGVLFHDGVEMTADDVVFSYMALRDGTTISSSIIDAFDADGDGKASAEEVNGSIDADGDGVFEGVKKIDDYTVQFVMAKPYGQFFLSTLGVPIIPEHIWKDHLTSDGVVDTLWNDPKAAIGTGPFYYAGGKDNVYREVKVFEDHWGKDFTTPSGHRIYPTEVTRIYFKLYTSLDTAILALKTGQVDHIPWAVTPGYVPDLISNPNTDVISISDNGYFYLAFNEKREPMNMLAFRQAVSHCIDKETIVQRYMGGYGQAGDSCEPPFWTDWYNSSVKHYPYNLTMARQVLQDAGFSWDSNGNLLMPDGRLVPPLVILTPPADYDPIRIKAGEMIANNLRKIGIDATAKPLDFDVLVAKMNAFDYDMLIIGWALSSDPIGNVFDIFGPKASNNYWAFWSENNDNPWYNKIGGVSTLADAETQALADKVQELGEKAKASFDREEQIKYTKWAQGVISEAVPVNVLYYRVNNYAINTRWNGWIPFMGEIFNGYSIAALTKSEAVTPVGEKVTAILNLNDKIDYASGADGKVLVVDGDGKPVAGASVSLQATGLTFHNASGTTDENGVFSFHVQPSAAGYVTVQATATSGENTFTVQKIVQVVKAKPDVLFLTVSPEKVFLTAGETDVITLKVTDQNGDPVEGATVELDEALMGYGSVDHATVTTDASGQATITYTAPDTVPMNKHAEVRLSLTATMEGYTSDFTSTATQYVVIKNTAASEWQFVKITDVSSFACNATANSTTITFQVIDQDGAGVADQTITVSYSNPDVLFNPPASVVTNATGVANITVQFRGGIDTNATQIWFKNEMVPNGVGAGVTVLYKGTTTPSTPIYGGIVEFNGVPMVDADSGVSLPCTIKLYDIDGNPATGTVPVGLIIGAPPQGSTATMENAPDYLYTSIWDYAGIQVFTSYDSGAISTGGYFLSDLYNDTEINELNDGLYDSWASLQADWWTFVDYNNMSGFEVVNGEATFNITVDNLVLSDNIPSIVVVPLSKAGFYVAPDYSNFYWQIDGGTAFKTDFVITRTQKILSVEYEIETGLLRDMAPGNTTNVTVTVIDQDNQPVAGVTVDMFVKVYGASPAFDVTVAGKTDANGTTSGTIMALAGISNTVKQPFYMTPDLEGYASVFASTEIFNTPVQLYLTVDGPMYINYDETHTADFTITVSDDMGNMLSDVGLDLSVDTGTLSASNGTTDANGEFTFTYDVGEMNSTLFVVPTLKLGATMDGYGAVSVTYKLLVQNPVPEVSLPNVTAGGTIEITGDTYTITGTVDNPSDVASITISVDGGEPVVVTLDGNTFTYTLTNLTPGQHTVTVTIVDSTGAEKTYTYTLSVSEEGGGVTKEEEGLPMLWIAVGVLVLIIIVVVVLLVLKKKPETPTGAPEVVETSPAEEPVQEAAPGAETPAETPKEAPAETPEAQPSEEQPPAGEQG